MHHVLSVSAYELLLKDQNVNLDRQLAQSFKMWFAESLNISSYLISLIYEQRLICLIIERLDIIGIIVEKLILYDWIIMRHISTCFRALRHYIWHVVCELLCLKRGEFAHLARSDIIQSFILSNCHSQIMYGHVCKQFMEIWYLCHNYILLAF